MEEHGTPYQTVTMAGQWKKTSRHECPCPWGGWGDDTGDQGRTNGHLLERLDTALISPASKARGLLHVQS
jgi:hypothetical protein